MKTPIFAALAAMLAPVAAYAHPGAHLHPHGVEGWVVGLGLVAMAVGGVVACKVNARQRGRK